jgi:hypothetical protein
MRSRFALLIAAAVVFAPGWYGQGEPRSPRGSDLAARVLAPTVDEGVMRQATADANHQFGGGQTKRWRPSFALGGVLTFGLGAIALVTFWTVASHRATLPRLLQSRFRFSRAPPHLQPA